MVVQNLCLHCKNRWDSLTGTKRIAHICGLGGCGMSPCTAVILTELKERLMPLIPAGRDFLEHRRNVGKEKEAQKQAGQKMVKFVESERGEDMDFLGMLV